jgi:transposase-like protein
MSLTKWFLCISIILSAKKGVSSRQLARHLSINKDTAWLLQKKVRQAMSERDVILEGIIEADESFIGGSRGNKYRSMRVKDGIKLGTGYQGKAPVLGMLEKSGKVITKVLNKAWGKEIIPHMKQWISPTSTIVTDGFGGYKNCSLHFEAHYVLNHSKNVHRVGEFHMNSIEGFWGMFKRALSGQYHNISITYLQNYFDELAFKYNHRKYTDRGFNVLISNMLRL